MTSYLTYAQSQKKQSHKNEIRSQKVDRYKTALGATIE